MNYFLRLALCSLTLGYLTCGHQLNAQENVYEKLAKNLIINLNNSSLSKFCHDNNVYFALLSIWENQNKSQDFVHEQFMNTFQTHAKELKEFYSCTNYQTCLDYKNILTKSKVILDSSKYWMQVRVDISLKINSDTLKYTLITNKFDCDDATKAELLKRNILKNDAHSLLSNFFSNSVEGKVKANVQFILQDPIDSSKWNTHPFDTITPKYKQGYRLKIKDDSNSIDNIRLVVYKLKKDLNNQILISEIDILVDEPVSGPKYTYRIPSGKLFSKDAISSIIFSVMVITDNIHESFFDGFSEAIRSGNSDNIYSHVMQLNENMLFKKNMVVKIM
jgi:hypothetical protein